MIYALVVYYFIGHNLQRQVLMDKLTYQECQDDKEAMAGFMLLGYVTCETDT